MIARPATFDQIREAIRVLLGGLPVGMEMRFYWKDGLQHMDWTEKGETQTAKLVRRNDDGCGTFVKLDS